MNGQRYAVAELGCQRGREFRNDASDRFFIVVGVRRRVEFDFGGVAVAVASGAEPAVAPAGQQAVAGILSRIRSLSAPGVQPGIMFVVSRSTSDIALLMAM